MRNVTLPFIAALLTLGAQAQVIFTSGFEDWSSNLPTDWYGSKSSIPQANVLQVTDAVHGGASAVRLVKEGTGHQRFTTQPQTVAANQEYEVRFWVRGEGQIRLGLYDGRATGSGYATYTPYANVTGNAWQEVVLSITAALDAANAEFILSVQSTVAPEHLVVDDVTITASAVTPPTPATIGQIQQTSDPSGDSPMVGTTVITHGLVSALLSNGFFLQDGTGPWSGLYVFGTPSALAVGDEVDVTGTVAEFNGQTQLSSVLNITTLTSGNAVAPTVISTLEGNTEPYESVFVKVQSASCTAQGSFGQYTVNDGSGNLLVDDVIYAHPFAVGETYHITGVIQFAYDEWRLLPRSAADVETVTGIAEAQRAPVAIWPNPATDAVRVEGIAGPAAYLLTDALGRTVAEGALVGGTLSVAGLPAGSYLLQVAEGNAARQVRLVVGR